MYCNVFYFRYAYARTSYISIAMCMCLLVQRSLLLMCSSRWFQTAGKMMVRMPLPPVPPPHGSTIVPSAPSKNPFDDDDDIDDLSPRHPLHSPTNARSSVGSARARHRPAAVGSTSSPGASPTGPPPGPCQRCSDCCFKCTARCTRILLVGPNLLFLVSEILDSLRLIDRLNRSIDWFIDWREQSLNRQHSVRCSGNIYGEGGQREQLPPKDGRYVRTSTKYKILQARWDSCGSFFQSECSKMHRFAYKFSKMSL